MVVTAAGMRSCTLLRMIALAALHISGSQGSSDAGVLACLGCCNPDGSIAVSGTLCRNSTGTCDKPAYCDGTSPVCPDNPFRPENTVCRLSSGCGLDTTCNGTSADCPPSSPAPKSTVCFIPDGNPCQLTAHCDGDNITCPQVYEADDTECMWNPFDAASMFKFVTKASPEQANDEIRRVASVSARYVPPRKFGLNCPAPRCNDGSGFDEQPSGYPGGRSGYYASGSHHSKDNKHDWIYRRNSHYPTCQGVCAAGHCFKALDYSGCCVIDGMEHLEEGLYCWQQ